MTGLISTDKSNTRFIDFSLWAMTNLETGQYGVSSANKSLSLLLISIKAYTFFWFQHQQQCIWFKRSCCILKLYFNETTGATYYSYSWFLLMQFCACVYIPSGFWMGEKEGGRGWVCEKLFLWRKIVGVELIGKYLFHIQKRRWTFELSFCYKRTPPKHKHNTFFSYGSKSKNTYKDNSKESWTSPALCWLDMKYEEKLKKRLYLWNCCVVTLKLIKVIVRRLMLELCLSL